MSHRLQILVEEDEFAAIRAAAKRRHLTVSEYVRQTLREARDEEPTRPVSKKLLVVREAAQHAYPTGSPEQIEAEITRGYSALVEGGLDDQR